MRKELRRKYWKVRKEMKAELREMMNPSLALLLNQTYITYQQRRLLYEVWHRLGTKHPQIYKKEFCGEGGLVGEMLCGRFDEFFNIIYFVDKDFYLKYKKQVPERLALGDAHAVALSYINEMNKRGREERNQ